MTVPLAQLLGFSENTVQICKTSVEIDIHITNATDNKHGISFQAKYS